MMVGVGVYGCENFLFVFGLSYDFFWVVVNGVGVFWGICVLDLIKFGLFFIWWYCIILVIFISLMFGFVSCKEWGLFNFFYLYSF